MIPVEEISYCTWSAAVWMCLMSQLVDFDFDRAMGPVEARIAMLNGKGMF